MTTTTTAAFGVYLKDNVRAGNIDFSIRARIREDGLVDFYIHPANVSGETRDYLVGTRGKAATHVENLEFIKRLIAATANPQ